MGSAVKTTYKYRCSSGIGQWAGAGRIEELRCLKQTPKRNTALKTANKGSEESEEHSREKQAEYSLVKKA